MDGSLCSRRVVWATTGTPPYGVSRWLGHASLTTTDNVYSLLYPSDHADDMARLDAYVDNAPEVRLHRGPR